MSVYKPKKSDFWQYDFQIKGRRFYGSTQCKTKRKAEEVERQLKEQVKSGSYLSKITFDDASGIYFDQVAKWQRNAPTTERQIETLVRIIGKDTLATEIDNSVVANYVTHRRGEKDSRYKDQDEAPRISPSTVNREVEVLRAILIRIAENEGVAICKINWSKHFLEEPEAPDRALNKDQEDKLFAELVDHAKPVVEFALMSGVRKENAVQLRWEQVDWHEKKLHFMVKSKKPGGRRHVLQMHQDMIDLLLEQGRKESGPVFTYGPPCDCTFCKKPQNHGKGLTSIRSAWEGAMRRAGTPEGFRFHDLRHTVGARVTKDMGLKAAMKYLGHKDIQTTVRYAHYEERDSMDIMGNLSRRKSRKNPGKNQGKLHNLFDLKRKLK